MQIGNMKFCDAAVSYLSSTYVYISSGYPVMPMNLIRPSSFNFCNAGIVSFTICSSSDVSAPQAMHGTYKTASRGQPGGVQPALETKHKHPSMTFFPAKLTMAQHQQCAPAVHCVHLSHVLARLDVMHLNQVNILELQPL